MTKWETVAADFRKALANHADDCLICVGGGYDKTDGAYVVMVSDKCRHGAMLLSEVVIADIQAEVEAVKKMHGGAP